MEQMEPLGFPASNHTGLADSVKIPGCWPAGPWQVAPRSYFRWLKFERIDLASYAEDAQKKSTNLLQGSDLIDT